ncbi:MAG: hypothetical protein QME62_12850 [Armatimonadota bacterium]|nr:hypothetical protein [Armatimonadota bacterium]
MKKLIFVLVLVALAAELALTIAMAEVTTITSPPLPRKWNLISLPAIPKDPDPSVVFAGFPLENSALWRYDAPNTSFCCYDPWCPGPFGGALITDGYWLWNETAGSTISYEAVTENYTTDMWISLPGKQNDNIGGGWTLIGTPYDVNYPWENVKVTDGTQTITVKEACNLPDPWLAQMHFYFNAEYQSLETLSYPEQFPNSTELVPWHGYWINSLKDNLALILEAPAPS